MELGLKVVRGVPGEGRVLPIPMGRRLLLGKHTPEQGIDLQVEATSINRHHCDVWRDAKGVWVEDWHSRNGTFVNGNAVPVHQAVLLDPCDQVQVGPALLKLIFLGEVEATWLTWGDGTVARLAQGVLEHGWRKHGSVLRDALLDAGCDDADILDHCLDGCLHVADCSLLPLLLAIAG
jgi:hypothetical protein